MSKSIEKILILSTDFLTINLAGIIYFMLRVKTGWFDMLIMPEMFISILIIYFYWVIIFTFVGMYRTWFAASRFDEISTLFKASFVGIFLLFFAIFLDDYFHGVPTGTRILIFIYWGIFLVFVGTGRIFIRSFQRNLLIKGFGRRNALIVGFNTKGNEVHDQILEHRALGIDVKGYVSLNSIFRENSYKGISILGSVNEIQSLIDETDAKEVILALDRDDHDMLVEVITKCEPKNVGMKIVPDLYDILSGQARTSQIYGVPLIDIMPQLMPEWEKRLKRILDIIVSLIILVINFPIITIASLAIKLDSKGPVFFRQERCGLNNKTFRIIKFRSMQHDAEKMTGPVWSQKGDPRITRVGNIIRMLRIDEIPQMYNVLKGEMSLVGPRPERPFFVEKLSEQIPYYKRRLKVRPGITGWAQVKHKYDESIEDVRIKLRYDLFYIENMSLRMDFKILFRTVFVVLFARGHYD
ncbi:MAG: exopolysaccharide biosynthesis polyprenyl glycosylphosphotransferase [Ignavibacteria bacterium RIFOXYB2_FULL_35_12]|nr:MAG: exopolysaccharide biosynthesis polyprenyl glycosylphosphotransferase [Ignavibacteria bacterium GWA2_36_19]OGU61427.1 MAG: exopolysaccharide biosynthesis polyprenyl glycosylphosphotransferase [Ignavibacteria bacterium GWF2_35_20]OGU78841.1 MAG: exopolysaccharide biosynthesis polyprenyl glycosylphosphotransferase [Ignavibacteria bacterium RIFOXYA2_FULL_35_9]OGU85460.1 MAG: exopolysaccharide biosynthesis polyprenyl glycosylphosphotransferase [Ignavibacteria bacterium RIFOXYA12_FULL_35_25]O